MDHEEFERVVERHKDRIYSYAAWMLRDPEDARDVTQEAMVRMWRHREKIREATSRSWLLTTAHRLCIDRMRHRKRRPEVEADEAVPIVDRAPGPERRAGSSETAEAIGAALATLGEQERAAVLLREIEGMSYDEIARTLEVPLGTLKAKLHRARDRLRRELIGAGVTP